MPVLNVQEVKALGMQRLTNLDKARKSNYPEERLENCRDQAEKLRDKMLAGKQIVFCKTVELNRIPYPTKYGFHNAGLVPTPVMHLLNRLFVVQFETTQGIKTLLFSPSDVGGSGETPYFKRYINMLGAAGPWVNRFLAPISNTVEQALAKMGIMPDQVDYISYNDLHAQDLRNWFGSHTKPGYFPNAKLLVMQQEWKSVQQLLPPQSEWYCPNGFDGVPEEKIIELEASVSLGGGVALVHTPGHTVGSHSLVINTDDGIYVCSANGVAADSYSPEYSKISGLSKYAHNTDSEVILNGNMLENSLEQYISMVVEKTIAGTNKQNSRFYNVIPCAELQQYRAFPGLKPTFSIGNIEYGSVRFSESIKESTTAVEELEAV